VTCTQAHPSPRRGVGSLRTGRGPNVAWCRGAARPGRARDGEMSVRFRPPRHHARSTIGSSGGAC